MSARDPFASVRRSIEKEVSRHVSEGAKAGAWGKIIDAAYRVYESARVESGVLLPVDDVVTEINAARERAEDLRREANRKASVEAEREYRIERARHWQSVGY